MRGRQALPDKIQIVGHPTEVKPILKLSHTLYSIEPWLFRKDEDNNMKKKVLSDGHHILNVARKIT